jgi:hypothetical protein|tara:strand:- start:1803 stop:2027 length:225 start_codon:yes stop_codon:yes gene_type:complete
MNKKIVSEIIKRQYTIMMEEEKSMKQLLKAETNLAPTDQLTGLYGRIEQHLGIISHAQNKIMLLQEIANQDDEG